MERFAPASATRDGERSAPGQAWVTLAPSGDRVAAPAPDRDAALWALVAGLGPEGRLSLRYAFGGDGEPARASLSMSAAPDAEPPLRCPAEALRRAARLAFPGLIVAPASLRVEPGSPWGGALLGPRRVELWSALVAAGDGPASVRPKPVCPAAVGEPLSLSRRPLAALKLDATLLGLRSLGLPCALTVSVSPFALDAHALRALGQASEALAIRGAAAVEPRGARRIAALAHAVALWRESPRGVRVAFRFEASGSGDPALALAAARMLFGDGEVLEAAAEPLDLSLALPDGAVPPPLSPDPSTLAAAGFLDLAPASRPAERGLVLGADATGRPVAIALADLSRHTYVIGATGSGKSSLLAGLIAQDMAAGRPFVLIDPHGDLFADVCAAMPPAVAARAMIADAANIGSPFTLNLLEIEGSHAPVERNFVANQLVSLFKDVLYSGVPEAFGPMFEVYFRNALFLLMDAEGPTASLADFDRVFSDTAYRRSLMGRCADEAVRRFWSTTAPQAGGEASLPNMAPYIVSKLNQFTGNPLIRNIICAPHSSLDLPGALAQGRSVLCSLAKGVVGGPDAALLGGLITVRLFAAAMARARLPRGERHPVRVYLDEFQTFATGALGQMLAECRKFGLELVLANQSLAQVDGRGADIAHAVLANVGSILAFRVGPQDARRLAEWFGAGVEPETLQRLPDRRLVARLLRDGAPCPPVFVATDAAAAGT
jgi:hypothetical protein